jgi:hypothetical protein
VEQACEKYAVSERRACRVVRQWRGTQRYLPVRRTDEDQLTQAGTCQESCVERCRGALPRTPGFNALVPSR